VQPGRSPLHCPDRNCRSLQHYHTVGDVNRGDIEGILLRSFRLMVKCDAFLQRKRQRPIPRERKPDVGMIETEGLRWSEESR
jgi:hypothetical protein